MNMNKNMLNPIYLHRPVHENHNLIVGFIFIYKILDHFLHILKILLSSFNVSNLKKKEKKGQQLSIKIVVWSRQS